MPRTWIVIVALLGLLLGASAVAYTASSRARAADALAEERGRQVEALEARIRRQQQVLARVESDYATQELRLRQALLAVPNARTPEPVYKLLCERARCVPVDPVPTPTH